MLCLCGVLQAWIETSAATVDRQHLLNVINSLSEDNYKEALLKRHGFMKVRSSLVSVLQLLNSNSTDTTCRCALCYMTHDGTHNTLPVSARPATTRCGASIYAGCGRAGAHRRLRRPPELNLLWRLS